MKCNLIVDNSAVISLFVVGCFFLFPSHTEINTSLATEVSEGHIWLCVFISIVGTAVSVKSHSIKYIDGFFQYRSTHE